MNRFGVGLDGIESRIRAGRADVCEGTDDLPERQDDIGRCLASRAEQRRVGVGRQFARLLRERVAGFFLHCVAGFTLDEVEVDAVDGLQHFDRGGCDLLSDSIARFNGYLVCLAVGT